MGYQVLLDVLGSMFIGGVFLLTLMTVNNNAVTNMNFYNTDFLLQLSILDVINIMETDLKRIGYTSNPSLINGTVDCILEADSTSLTIRGDVDADSTIDTIRYFVSATSALSNTTNPRDRILYRKVNSGTPFIINTNCTLFNFVYFDSFGAQLPFPIPRAETGRVAMIQISLKIESPDKYNEDYANVYWRQIRLAARNLNNR